MRFLPIIISVVAVANLPIPVRALPLNYLAQKPNCNNPQTQSEMNICEGVRYQQADKRLNLVYKQLLPKLENLRRKKLITAQQAWINFRDKSCAFEKSEVEGGTMAPMIEAGCLAEMTKQRTAQLESYLRNMK